MQSLGSNPKTKVKVMQYAAEKNNGRDLWKEIESLRCE
jgi:hypothetical protein